MATVRVKGLKECVIHAYNGVVCKLSCTICRHKLTVENMDKAENCSEHSQGRIERNKAERSPSPVNAADILYSDTQTYEHQRVTPQQFPSPADPLILPPAEQPPSYSAQGPYYVASPLSQQPYQQHQQEEVRSFFHSHKSR